MAQELFKANQEGVSKIVWINAPKDQRAMLKAQKLPLSIQLRFVTVRLSTGELGVPVTSLLDEKAYPTSEFSGACHTGLLFCHALKLLDSARFYLREVDTLVILSLDSVLALPFSCDNL